MSNTIARTVVVVAFTLLVRGPSAQSAQTDVPKEEAVKLSPFEVNASTDVGYLAPNSTSATRFATASRDLPISLQTITNEMLTDQMQTDLNEALSASVGGLEAGNIPRQSIIRGMASDYPLRNGIPTFGIQDIAHIERIEVVKGASGLLYGVTQPGGVRNLISVRPPLKNQFSIRQRLDSDDRARTEVRFGGPIGAAGKLAYRLIAVYDEYQKYADWQTRYDRLLYPAILWKPTPGTTVFVEYDYKIFNNIGTVGFPKVRVPGETVNRNATQANSGLDLPYGFNVAGPSPQQFQRVRVANLIVDQKLGSIWAARATYSWQTYEGQGERYEQQGTLAPGAKTFNNIASLNMQRFPQEMARLDFLATVRRDNFTNRTLIGGDYLWRLNATTINRAATFNSRTGRYTTTLFPHNVADYATPTLANNWLYDFTDFTQRQPLFSQSKIWDVTGGAYAVDQLAFNRERTFVLGGLRYDRIKTATKSYVANYLPSPAYEAPVGTRVSPQLGMAHRLTRDVSVFANYSTSVYANTEINPDGTGFPPQYGEGWDAGGKIELWGGKISGSASIFRTDSKNIPIADPAAANDPARVGYFVLKGQSRAEGVDLSFTLAPTKPWQVVVSYTYCDAYDVLTGEQLTGTSTHSAKLWTRYNIEHGPLQGLTFGGGPRWRNKLYRGVVYEPFRGDITFVDLFASYTAKLGAHRYLLQLNVRNLTDRVTIDDFNHPYGGGRTFLGTVQFTY